MASTPIEPTWILQNVKPCPYICLMLTIDINVLFCGDFFPFCEKRAQQHHHKGFFCLNDLNSSKIGKTIKNTRFLPY